MSTITVPEPITSSFEIADRLRRLRTRVAGRLRLGLRFETTRFGLRRDLAQPFPAPSAKIPISVRPLVEADLPALLAIDATTSPEDRSQIASRRVMADRRMAGGFVAVDERDGRPCYVQWLFGPANNDFVRRLRGFPQLAADEALPTPRPATAASASCRPPWP